MYWRQPWRPYNERVSISRESEQAMALSRYLPEHVRAYIRKQVESGAFESEEAVITDAVEQVMEPEDPWGDERTQHALARAARGETTAVTDMDAFLHQLHDQARENNRRGVRVPHDVKYED